MGKVSEAKKIAARRKLGRRKFRDFVRYTFPGYRENWHHRVIMEALHGAATFQKEYRRTIIVTPPRHGKSELVSRRLPAFAMGRYPQLEIIHCTYSGDLSEKMGRDVGDIIDSQEFGELFPNFQYGSKNTYTEKSTIDGGTYLATGIRGGVTGRGANLLLIDDPIKNREEAESLDIRNKVWESFNDDLKTRIEYPFSIVITMTRWHMDDLVGRLLEREGHRWNVIHLPLIADYHEYEEPWPDYDPRSPGEVLWPGVRVKGRIEVPEAEIPDDEELAQQIKEEYEKDVESNPYGTHALKQGRPTKKEGNLIKRDWLQEYSGPPMTMGKYCMAQLISVDANFGHTRKAGDDAAIIVLGLRRDGNILVLDAEWDDWDFPDLKDRVDKMSVKWPNASLLIERKANGPALLSSLEEVCTVIPFDPDGSRKEARANKFADEAKSGRFYLPAHAPWKSALEDIICTFPGGKTDDPVDAIAQAAIYWARRKAPLEELRRVTGTGKS